MMAARGGGRREGRRSLWLAISAAAAALALGGCAEGTGTGNLTVYVSAPLRGPSGADGRDIRDGARMALDDAGGEAGGRGIRLEALDDTVAASGGPRWSPVAAAENARTATQDSTAIAYVGELESGATRASIPITNQARMLQVSPASTAVDLTRAEPGTDDVPERLQTTGERTFARVIPDDDAQAAAAAIWADELGIERVGIVEDPTFLGSTLASAFRAIAQRLGVTAIPYAAALEGGAFEGAVFVAGERAGRFVLSPRSDGILATDAQLAPRRLSALAAIGPSVRVTSSALDPTQLPPAGRDLARRFERRFDREPGRYAAYGYEAMAVVLDSVDRATDAGDRNAVVEALFDTRDRRSVLGTYSIDRVGNTTLDRLGGNRVTEDGTLVPVRGLPTR